MKRFIAAAALTAAAIVPASAGAVPPGNASVPLGSTKGCFVVASPAGKATCNFVGAGSSDLGYIGGGQGTYAISHQQKVVTCTAGKVTGYHLASHVDDAGDLAPPNAASQTTWTNNIVYTITLTGTGWLAIGGSGTPGQDMASDPAVGAGPAYAGAEDATAGAQINDACS
jgi:hypothetical protein